MPTNTPKLGLPGSVVQGEGPGIWHGWWNQICANLEARLTKSGSADPNVAEIGHYVGQFYIRTGAEQDIYVCTALGTPDPLVNPATWVSLRHHTATFDTAIRQVYEGMVSTAGAVTPNFGISNFFAITLSENTTINNPASVVHGGLFAIQVTQGASAFTLAWGAKFIFPTGTPATIPIGQRRLFLFVVASNGDLVCIPELGSLATRSTLDSVIATQSANLDMTSTEQAIPGLDNLSIPLANGSRRYRLSLDLPLRFSTTLAEAEIRVRCGPLGTLADPSIFFRICTTPAGNANSLFPFCVSAFTHVPAAGDKLTVSARESSGAGMHITNLATFAVPAGQLLFAELP